MAVLSRSAAVLVLAGLCAAAPAAADAPALLGESNAWSAYQTSTANGTVCYVLAKPQRSEPATAKRDPIYLIISDWPGRKVAGEVEVVPGYSYRDGQKVTAQVGAQKADMFTNNDGGTGNAWVIDPGEESALVEAMRTGDSLVVQGISKRGTHTTDTYSLAGISEMLDKVHAACPAQ
jgi:hypothetical protein